MKRLLLTAGIAIASVTVPLRAVAASFSQLYVFGDSLSDSGNLYSVTDALNPFGGGIPQSPPYTQKFSNGPLWVEYLGDELGVQPSLLFSSQDSSEGINFAFGGANSGEDNSFFPSFSPLSETGAGSQVGLFSQLVNSGELTPDPDALYVFSAGANDFAGGLLSGPVEDITVPLNNTLAALNQLVTLGAENILVSNLPDISLTPRFNAEPAAPILSNLITTYNQTLFSQLALLQTSQPEVNFIEFDFNSLFVNAIASPTTYGFTNVTDPCLTEFDLFSSLLFGASSFEVCSEPSEFLFWDDFHPTTTAHQLVANAALAELNSVDNHVPAAVPEPGASWSLVVLGAGLVGGFVRRRG